MKKNSVKKLSKFIFSLKQVRLSDYGKLYNVGKWAPLIYYKNVHLILLTVTVAFN